MGSVKDPKDGAAAATTCFSAVVVYAVRCPSLLYLLSILHLYTPMEENIACIECGQEKLVRDGYNADAKKGLPRRLRFPSFPPPA